MDDDSDSDELLHTSLPANLWFSAKSDPSRQSLVPVWPLHLPDFRHQQEPPLTIPVLSSTFFSIQLPSKSYAYARITPCIRPHSSNPSPSHAAHSSHCRVRRSQNYPWRHYLCPL